MTSADVDTIIVGAGPAGLAVGAALRARRVPFVLLERDDRVGSSWQHHYERLHLHTPKSHSALPFRPYPRSYPRYPSRDQARGHAAGVPKRAAPGVIVPPTLLDTRPRHRPVAATL